MYIIMLFLCKALTKWTHKEPQGENLGLIVTPFGQALCALVLICSNLRALWLRSNLHASQSKYHRLATKPKSAQVL